MQKSYFFDKLATIFSVILLTFFLVMFFKTDSANAQAAGGPSPCISDPVTFGGVEKRLLPLPSECTGSDYCGRGEQLTGQYAPSPACVTPRYIVMHTTHGDLEIDAIYGYFANGSGGRHVGSHFGVGQDGRIIQMVEMGGTQVEYAQTVGGLHEHISIEMGAPGNYSSKEAAPPEQYESTLRLVKSLMQQYNIPLADVRGHYEFYANGAGDPGSGWMNDFLLDLPGASSLSGISQPSGSRTATDCLITQVGEPTDEKPPEPPECADGGGGSFGPCQAAPPPPDDIKQAIIDKWNITLNLNQTQLRLAWEEFHEIDCTGFLQDLSGTLVDTWGNDWAQQFSCPGTSGDQGATDVMFSPGWQGEFMKAILVHELTHVWQFCSSNGEQNLLDVGEAFKAEGGLTNYTKNLCPRFPIRAERRHHEDQADTIALYLNPEQGELTCGNGLPNPFQGGGYPLHRAAAEKGVGNSVSTQPGVGPLP